MSLMELEGGVSKIQLCDGSSLILAKRGEARATISHKEVEQLTS